MTELKLIRQNENSYAKFEYLLKHQLMSIEVFHPDYIEQEKDAPGSIIDRGQAHMLYLFLQKTFDF